MSRLAHLSACLLAVSLAAFGWWYRTGVASGADPYGYVSQASLWAAGSPVTPQPFMAELPWPDASFTMSPIGYRPAADDPSAAIVPVYSPGVALLMAFASRVAGPAAIYAVVPLFAALFVLATYGVGLRLTHAHAALAAAILAATSPTVVFMSMWPMADLAAAACWTAATWALLGPSRRRALAAGLVAGVALLIRPNLIAVGVAMGVWAVVRDVRRGAPWWRVDRAVSFGLGAAPGVCVVMAINQMLHGSAFTSGYGTLASVLSFSRVPENAVRYATWLVETQTPVVFIGVVMLALPVARLWRGGARAFDAALLTAVAAGTLSCYLAFTSLGEWWYLRFLLPVFPGVFIGLTEVLMPEPVARSRRWSAAIGPIVIAAMALAGLRVAEQKRFTVAHEGERRFVTAAELARDHTPAGSVIFSVTHSGSVRYYGERMTLKFDALDPAWLDRAADWLAARGAHPYALLEAWEVDRWRAYFGTTSARGRLAVAPVLEVNWPTHYWLFDLANPDVPAQWPVIGFEQPRVPADVPPGAPPRFPIRP